ncbi:hypothetical protein [Sphingorhabdus sp. EL138]|uniref:hypothetical protein n=1 Tax=Sphingorhabdus sp. EL138 TaxID=2073156 RepID=UPI0025FEC8E2|nr:hypothetical protein [Sphingorhabdus sp. EL138]
MIRKVLVSSVMTLFISSAPALAVETSEAKNAPIAIPAPPEGQGQVVFFRPGGTGFAVGCSVNEKGQKVSSLGAGRYFVMVAGPGRHEFTVKSEAKDNLALEVEAGETQYATCRIKMGIMIGRPDLAPSTEAEFRKHGKLKLVDADDMGPGEGALRPDQLTAAISTSSEK